MTNFPTNVVPTHTPPVAVSFSATMHSLVTCTIPSGTSTSEAIDMTAPNLFGFCPLLVYLPAAWTNAKLTVQMSFNNSDWHTVHRWFDNSAYTTQKTLNALDAVIFTDYPLRGCPYFRFVSGTEASPVTQAADRLLSVICGTY